MLCPLSVLGALLPLLHGNVSSSKVIITEFQEFCRQQLPSPTSSPQSDNVPKRYLLWGGLKSVFLFHFQCLNYKVFKLFWTTAVFFALDKLIHYTVIFTSVNVFLPFNVIIYLVMHIVISRINSCFFLRFVMNRMSMYSHSCTYTCNTLAKRSMVM